MRYLSTFFAALATASCAVASPSFVAHGREFVLADRDYAAPFFLGQDNPV